MSSGKQDWWVVGGMTVTAVSAAVSSFTGLRALAIATGWAPALAPLLPLTVDAYAMTATRVWLSAATRSERARRFARWNAIGAISLSLIGNAAWHLIAARVLTASWPIVVLVGAVPPAVLGLLSHLAVLRGEDEQDEPAVTEPPSEDSDASLLAAAIEADKAHRAEHGTPITRDELRRRLRVGTERATVLLRATKEHHNREQEL